MNELRNVKKIGTRARAEMNAAMKTPIPVIIPFLTLRFFKLSAILFFSPAKNNSLASSDIDVMNVSGAFDSVYILRRARVACFFLSKRVSSSILFLHIRVELGFCEEQTADDYDHDNTHYDSTGRKLTVVQVRE